MEPTGPKLYQTELVMMLCACGWMASARSRSSARVSIGDHQREHLEQGEGLAHPGCGQHGVYAFEAGFYPGQVHDHMTRVRKALIAEKGSKAS